ncbi:MAG: hypothetical protein ACRED1_08565, partial [Limisphaerales bacterium]
MVGPAAVATNGITYMSSGNGNVIWDMIPSQNLQAGSIGVTWALNGSYTNAAAGLWFSAQSGKGSNTWGLPVYIPGGVVSVGNPFWLDLSNDVAQYAQNDNAGWFWGFGPRASKLSTAWASGSPGVGSTYQPYFNVENANPFGGGAAIDIRSGFTNANYPFMVFEGDNGDGVPIYLQQYGYWMGTISDDYRPLSPMGNGESEDSAGIGGLCFIGSQPINYYVTYNGQRPGDSGDGGFGQIPAEVIDVAANGVAHAIFRIPYQVANVWMPETNGPSGVIANPSWRDSLSVDEVSGTVQATNGPEYFKAVRLPLSTNVPSATFPGYQTGPVPNLVGNWQTICPRDIEIASGASYGNGNYSPTPFYSRQYVSWPNASGTTLAFPLAYTASNVVFRVTIQSQVDTSVPINWFFDDYGPGGRTEGNWSATYFLT